MIQDGPPVYISSSRFMFMPLPVLLLNSHAQNKLASCSPRVASSVTHCNPPRDHGQVRPAYKSVCGAVSRFMCRLSEHLDSRDFVPHCLSVLHHIGKMWTTCGCLQADWNLHSNDLKFQMFSALGVILLMTVFLNIVFRFYLIILCHIEKLYNRC